MRARRRPFPWSLHEAQTAPCTCESPLDKSRILCIEFRCIEMNLKGTLPALILEILAREPSHGYRIAQDIKERSKGLLDFKEGTLYPALHKLENEAMVESYEGVERGRPRRYYRITQAGRKALNKDRAEWHQLSQAVSVILGEA